MESKFAESEIWGAKYFAANAEGELKSKPSSAYSYVLYAGSREYQLDSGDCAFSLSPDAKSISVSRGMQSIQSKLFSVKIRGYAPVNQTVEISSETVLPYINGCSTRQLIHPQRPGDPTAQLLKMPPYTSEQFHHVHSTPRVVYVLEGSGKSVVGMSDKNVTAALEPGMIVVLDSMCPHHFETQHEWLVVLPIHIWSTSGNAEFAHPMYHGTHRA